MRRPGAESVTACHVSSIAGTRYPGGVPARRVSSITGCEGTEDDDDKVPEDDDDEVPDASNKLDDIKIKNYALTSLIEMEEAGTLELRPFYQRGYKWTQKQASLWIESMLRGYPCLPEVTLIERSEDDSYAVFDGQQRLTSMKLFIKGERADTWKATNAQKKAGTTHTFALEGLVLLKSFEGKTFKDLEQKQQQQIKRKYDVRCAIIPDTWSMTDYIDFFKRIQGGGTPMSDQELRRAIARGPFTDLVDAIAGRKENDIPEGRLLHEALKGANLQPDEVADLLMRYFALQSDSIPSFGRPSMSQHGLELMRRLNANPADVKIAEWRRKLAAALEAVIIVFPNEQERFRRAKRSLNGEFQKSDGVNKAIWDCLLYSFGKPGRKEALIEKAEVVRHAFIELMQTNPAFESLATKGTGARITALEAVLDELLSITTVASPVSPRLRSQLIKSARDADKPCGICNQALGPSDDLLHIDHKVPRARGGSSDTENLHVVHKACNLKKGIKDLPSPLD